MDCLVCSQSSLSVCLTDELPTAAPSRGSHHHQGVGVKAMTQSPAEKYTANGSENLMFTLSVLCDVRRGKAVFIHTAPFKHPREWFISTAIPLTFYVYSSNALQKPSRVEQQPLGAPQYNVPPSGASVSLQHEAKQSKLSKKDLPFRSGSVVLTDSL